MNDLEIEQCSTYKWNGQPHSWGTHNTELHFGVYSHRGDVISSAPHTAYGRLQTDTCLPSCRTQSRVDLCCCLKWLESRRISLPRKCCLFWAGKRKNNQSALHFKGDIPEKKPKLYLSVWSKWCYGTSFPFSLFIRPAQLVSLTILLSILNTTSFPLFHVSKLRLPLTNSIFLIPFASYLTSHSPSPTPTLLLGSACVLPLQRNWELFLNYFTKSYCLKTCFAQTEVTSSTCSSPWHPVRTPPFSVPAILFRCEGLNLNMYIELMIFKVL